MASRREQSFIRERQFGFQAVLKGNLMGICWYCYWGWAKPVAEIYVKYSALVSDPCAILDYGPERHIVWADENFETEHIDWCIANAEKWRKHEWDAGWPPDMQSEGLLLADADFLLAVESLKELLGVPEHIRCCAPADYDDLRPENFPPTIELMRPYVAASRKC